jgi:DNA-binding NtrC family response regulator
VDEPQTDTIDPSLLRAAPLPVRLVVMAGPDTGRQLEVRNGTVLVGTHADCQLQLSDTGVSRRHVSLELSGARVRVSDLGSKNGTRYLGAKFTRLDVPVGATIELGTTSLALLPLLRDGALSDKHALGGLVGRSAPMRRLYALLEQVGPTDASCLVRGETGTGKELLVRTLHALSHRAKGPFVAVDCGGITSSLVSSVLFGHVEGAFTGAVKDAVGLIEAANGGTLFLDDVSSLPLDTQPLLLRVLEGRTYQRVGEGRERTSDFRVVAATTRDLQLEAKEGRFRMDLYYRLASITLDLPPLRERLDDVPVLAAHFAKAAGAKTTLPAGAVASLSAWRWPGNVRELKNAVERAVTLGEAPLPDQPASSASEDFHGARDKALAAFERSYLEALLTKHKGSASAVAREAGIARSYLYRLLETHGLTPENYRGR